jgi:DNA invertase Pin-like site-specific DNA recombinase
MDVISAVMARERWRGPPPRPNLSGWEVPMLVVLYLRRSTDDMQPDSLIVQEELDRAFCAKNGHEVVRVYSDSASGRSTKKRKDFKALIDKVNSGPDLEGIVTRDVSRWGRFENVDEGAFWEFTCLSKGVRVLYVEESFSDDGTPYSVLMKTLKRVIASEFSRDKSRMVRYTQARVVRNGFRHGGSSPYGMKRIMVRLNGEYVQDMAFHEWKSLSTFRTKLAPGDPEEVAVVQRIFGMFVDDGLTRTEIAEKLTLEQVRRREGSKWHVPTINQILSNPAYMGAARYQLRNPGEKNDRRTEDLFKNTDEVILTHGAWLGIVSVEMWQKANERLRALAWRRMDGGLIGQLKTALETWGYVSGEMMKVVEGAASWQTYRNRFKYGCLGALEAGYAAEIRGSRDALRQQLQQEFAITDEGNGWTLNDRLHVGFRYSFPRAWLGGLHWEFRFDGDENDEVTIGMGFSPPPAIKHVDTFVFDNRKIRRKRRIMPNLDGGKVAEKHRRTGTASLAAELRRALLFKCSATERAFIEAATAHPMFEPVEIASELGWPASRARYMYRRLTTRGIGLPPRRVKVGRRIDVVCARCGSIRVLPPSAAMKFRTHLCGPCNLFQRTKDKLRVECPTCAKVRFVWPSAFAKLSHGSATECHSCVARQARKRFLARTSCVPVS